MLFGTLLLNRCKCRFKFLFIKLDASQEPRDLSFEVSFFKAFFTACLLPFLVRAVVIDVLAPEAIDLMLCRDARSALPAPDQSGVSEAVLLGARTVYPAQEFLRSLKLRERYNRLVFAR